MALLYIVGIRTRMDFATGMVGIRTFISWQAMREALYVEPGQGNCRSGSPSREQVRRYAGALQRAGLIRIASSVANRQLIFECVLADTDKHRRNKPDIEPTHQADRGADTPAQRGKGVRADTPADISKAGKADTHPGSGKYPTTTTTDSLIQHGSDSRRRVVVQSSAGAQGNDKDGAGVDAAALVLPSALRPALQQEARAILSGSARPQVIADEFAGAIAKGREIRSPLRWLAKIVELDRVGQFTPEFADAVCRARERALAQATPDAARAPVPEHLRKRADESASAYWQRMEQLKGAGHA